jgi:hypothetical protein
LETTKELNLINDRLKKEAFKLIDLNNNFKNILSSKTVEKPTETSKQETTIEKPIQENIEDSDYEEFVETGNIDEEILDNIANKIKNSEALSPRETDIYNNKTEEINNKLKDIKASEDKFDSFQKGRDKEGLTAINSENQTENLLNEAINGNNKVYSELANVLKIIIIYINQ